MGDWTMTWRGGAVEARLRAAVAQAARLAGEHILSVSQDLVPIEEGTLQRSGRVTVDIDRDGATAAISYGTPYAVRQHEELGYRHDPGRQAKYLEQPLRSEGKAVNAIIRGQIRGAP